MADPRFYKVEGPFDTEQLAQISGSTIRGKNKKGAQFIDIEPLSSALDCHVSFIDNPKYIKEFLNTKAGAILVSPSLTSKAPSNATLLVMEKPYLGYAKLTQAFYPLYPMPIGLIESGATVHSLTKIGKNVNIENGAIICQNASIGAETFIGANSYIGQGVEIGANCYIAPNVTITHSIIGNKNIIHPGARIGQDGFGFSPGSQSHTKINQLGRVIIGDQVEIGANTTVDRGAGPDTIIGNGTKIDNLVHIAHNVQIGEGCFITAQNGFAGSAKVGNFVSFGGQAGVTGHITIGDRAQVSGKSGVTKDVAPGATVAGLPAQSAREYWNAIAMIRKLVGAKRG